MLFTLTTNKHLSALENSNLKGFKDLESFNLFKVKKLLLYFNKIPYKSGSTSEGSVQKVEVSSFSLKYRLNLARALSFDTSYELMALIPNFAPLFLI